MPGYTKSFSRQTKRVDPITLGLNGVTLDVARTSNAVDVTGCNQFKLDVVRVNNSGTATSFYLETSFDGGTTWTRNVTGRISSGTETLSPHVISMAVTTLAFNYYYALFGEEAQMRVTFAATSDAVDTVTVNVTLGVSG
jgi:hypothetical protein